MRGFADIIGLGVLLRWQDKATSGMKKAEQSLQSLSGSADEAEEKASKLEKRFGSLSRAGAVITGFGLAGAASLYGLARAASTYEDTLRDTMTMTGLTGRAFEEMERDLGALATSMSTQFGMAASDISKSFYQVLSAGAKAGTKDFRALSESALMLARVVGMEPVVMVESLSDALHSFEMDVADAEKMADVFFKTSMLGATTVPQIADAMKEASKVAVELRLPLEDVAAVLTGFASKGVKGAEAGTAFRMVMTRLAAPVKKTRDALDSLGVAVYDADTRQMRPLIEVLKEMQGALGDVTHEEREAALKAIAGEQAFAKLGGLLSTDLSIIEDWSKALHESGSMQLAFSQKAATASFAFAGMRESLRNITVELGKHLLPLLTPAARGISTIAGKVRDFLAAHPIITRAAVGFSALAVAAALVIGPVLALVGTVGALGGVPVIIAAVTAGFAGLATVAATLGAGIAAAFWPVTAVVVGLAGLYLAFKTNFLGIRSIVASVGKVVWSLLVGAWEGVKAALAPAIAAIREAWDALKDALSPIWEAVEALSELIGFSLEGTGVLELLKKGAGLLGKVIGFAIVIPVRVAATALAYLVRGFAGFLSVTFSVGRWLGEKLGPVINLVGKAFGFLRDVVGRVVEGFGVFKMLASEVLEAWSRVGKALTGIFTAIADTVAGVFGKIRDTVTGIIGAIWNKVEWVISKIPDVFLPGSLEKIKYARLEEKTAAVGGQLVVPATAPASERAVPRPVSYTHLTLPTKRIV